MHHRLKIAGGAALLASSVALTVAPAVALSVLPRVTVRIEGKARPLLPITTVTTRSASITKFGAPDGVCPGTSAAGALAVATHGNWTGTWSKTYKEYFVTGVAGERDNGPKLYWSVYVNGVSTPKGVCETKLHSGDAVLFAATTYPSYPLAITAPTSASVEHPFTVTVKYYTAKGKLKPLAGATVAVGAHSGTTGRSGSILLTPSHTGTFTVTASKKGYVRAEASVSVGY
jgi:hypothetical protein